MERLQEVRHNRGNALAQAYARWNAFQPDLARIATTEANRDGTVPRPRIGEVTPEQRARFAERQRARVVFNSAEYRNVRLMTERMIGATLDFADLPPDEQALKAGRPVVRIVTMGGAGIIPQGFATGFLIAPDLILTNHHVFRGPDEAQRTGVQFLYERTHEGLREGLIFRLQPERFFINNRGLDYAVVAVQPTATNGAPLSQFKYLPLIGAKGKARKGDPVNIIQHPNGQAKQYATVNNRLLDLRDDGFLLYETDTLEGSSGSPVFNQYWETIGLHHCGVPQMDGDQMVLRDGRRVSVDAEVADSDVIWVANEGIRVSALVASLADQRLDDPAQRQILARLCESTKDPLRIVTEKSPIVGPAVPPDVSASASREVPMSSGFFHFTGPVTINVLSPAAPQPIAVVPRVVAPPQPVASQEEFRERTLRFDERYDTRHEQGYDSDFLAGWPLPLPSVNATHDGTLLRKDGETWVIPYYHYSLAMNEKRRLLAWAASNVDYSEAARRFTKSRKEYGGENWRPDPRVTLEAPGLQLQDADFYKPAKRIDRGHIVRREDGAWGGSASEAEFGNSDTYHWTNCTPQHEAFNQSGLSGIWGQFEIHIQEEVGSEGGRMTVFAGPVLNPDDPTPESDDADAIQVPMEYWKVVIAVSREGNKRVRRAYGFVFDQSEPIRRIGFGFERMNMDDFEVYQMPIADITKKTGVVFDPSILQADVMKEGANESVRGFSVKRITELQQVVVR